MKDAQPLTKYIKNWVDKAEIKFCCSHKTLCRLTEENSVPKESLWENAQLLIYTAVSVYYRRQ